MGRRGGWGLDPLGVKYLRPDCAGGWAELGHIGLECWYLILKRELEPSGGGALACCMYDVSDSDRVGGCEEKTAGTVGDSSCAICVIVYLSVL